MKTVRFRFGKIALLAVLTLVLAALPVLTRAEIVDFTGDPAGITYGLGPLSGVPEYSWYHGCSPTSGGMLMGYWAEQGYTQLLPNVSDPMVQSDAVNNDIASPQHNANDTYAWHTANSIADFMKTVRGGTFLFSIAPGLVKWSNYVGVTASAHDALVSLLGGSFTYNAFKTEIDAGRAMLLNMITYGPGYGWVGHTVMAYGYQDSMFNLRVWNGLKYINVTVPGFAVMDTWKNGAGPNSQSSWMGWNGETVYSQIDSQGREWWPFLDLSLTRAHDDKTLWDWQIDDGVFYQPTDGLTASSADLGLMSYAEVPVPATVWLFSSGLVGIFFWPRRKAA